MNKDWENAEENSRDILNKLKTRPVTNYSHIGTVYTALAFSYHIYQNYEKAEENYQSALKFYDPFKKSDQRRRSNALIGLAMVHQTNGKEGKASSLIQEAEESIRLYNPEKYDSIGDILFFKAQILNHQGNRNEAISVYQEAISNYQREEDPDELRQAAALYLIADIYITEERPDKAEPLLTKTKSIFKEKLGRRHKLTKKVNELLSAIESDMVSEYNAKNSREPTDLFTKDTMEVPAKIVY
ncbi:MAG TPA: hypothetical protein DCZ13_05020, partial [Porticoccaceae bacterium]|nr:hypothetical protein [Porticoccaceae bacterium]